MTSRERVLATLNHRHADRVPVAEMWIDRAIARAIAPDARDSNDLAEFLGLDMVTVPTMIYEPHEVVWVDREAGTPSPHACGPKTTSRWCARPRNLGNTRSANIRNGFAKSADHLALVSATGPAMKIAFMPAVYENAARFMGHPPWEVSRDPELLFAGHRAAYLEYRHRPIAVGIEYLHARSRSLRRQNRTAIRQRHSGGAGTACCQH